jgi:hypothetical protein
MTKRFLTVAAATAMVLAFSQQMFAAITEELTLTANGITATVTWDTVTGLSVVCSTAGQCGNLTTHFSTDDVLSTENHGTIETLVGASFQGYTLSDTAVGADDSTLPTLQDLNQINADKTSGGAGVLTSTFTDTQYTDLSSMLNVADSNVSDAQIKTSTIAFNVYTDAGNAIPAGTSVETNSLTGESNSNGIGGVVVGNPNFPDGSLTSQTIMTFAGLGSIQANISISNVAVPEPASIVLLGTMILGLTALIRKKQEKRA